MIGSKKKDRSFRKKSVVWVSPLLLDIQFHKTSRIEILRHLAELGYDVHLIAVQSKKRYSPKNQSIDVVQIPLRFAPLISQIFFGAITFLFLPLYIVRKRPEFIIVEPNIGTLGFMWKPLLSRLMKFKVILDIRSTPVDITSGLRAYFKRFQFNISVLMAKKMFDGMTIITWAMRKEVSEKFDLDAESIGIWPDAASIELFTHEKNVDYGLKLRKKFGLSSKFIIFCHGHIGLLRGALESSEAIVKTKKEYPDIVLFLLGTGAAATLNAIKNLIQKHGIEDRVILHEPVSYEDVPKYIAMCDVGIVPLPNIPIWRNQCPLKLLEYLAMKRTVIVTDIPANREIVGDRKCGIYVSSCDPAEIAEAMVFAYVNREKLEEWGKIGRMIVIQEYNWGKAAKDLETYLLKVESGLAGW